MSTPEPSFWQLLRPARAPPSPSPTSPLRGTRVTIPTRGRAWDTVLESVPPRAIDVRLELFGTGAQRARVRVVSTERVRLVVARRAPAQRFLLQIDAGDAPVEVFLPSDFAGGVQLAPPAPPVCFSAGVRNRMLQGEAAAGGVYLVGTDRMLQGTGTEDEVRIRTGPRARVRVRLWDVERDAPERWWAENVYLFRSAVRRVTGY